MIRHLRGLDRYPIRLVSGILLLTIGICALSGWSVYHTQRVVVAGERRLLRQEQLHGSIQYLDEVLTMSARMAAASGAPQWDARYHRYAETAGIVGHARPHIMRNVDGGRCPAHVCLDGRGSLCQGSKMIEEKRQSSLFAQPPGA